LRHIEEGNFKSLPPGFYARAFVRAYAEAHRRGRRHRAGGALRLAARDASGLVACRGFVAAGAALLCSDAAELIPDARMQVLKQLLNRHNDSVAIAPSSPATAAADAGAMPRTAPIPRRVD
jgi:hypothetical protein